MTARGAAHVAACRVTACVPDAFCGAGGLAGFGAGCARGLGLHRLHASTRRTPEPHQHCPERRGLSWGCRHPGSPPSPTRGHSTAPHRTTHPSSRAPLTLGVTWAGGSPSLLLLPSLGAAAQRGWRGVWTLLLQNMGCSPRGCSIPPSQTKGQTPIPRPLPSRSLLSVSQRGADRTLAAAGSRRLMVAICRLPQGKSLKLTGTLISSAGTEAGTGLSRAQV